MVSEEESNKNLECVMDICTKVSHLKSEIKRELKEHPDYKVGSLCIDPHCGMIYIVLDREHLGVSYSTCIEIKFERV